MLGKLQQLPAEALYTALAVVGGIANYLSAYLRGATFDLRHFLAHAFVSGFSGLMFAQFAEFLGWAPQARSMAAGVGGFMGAKAVEYVAERLLARTSSNSSKGDTDGIPPSKQARRRQAPSRRMRLRKVPGPGRSRA
jgi:hypothetical protein